MGGPGLVAGVPPSFDVDVPAGGYAWWYLDALSEDGTQGLTVIAFVGSVFSPYYAWARRRRGVANADPLDHCAINVALYGRSGPSWAMTERGRGSVRRDATCLEVGPSALRWQADGTLRIVLDEVTAPLPRRIRGQVVVRVPQRFLHDVALAPGQRWCPIAPANRVEVDLECGMRWSGSGYLDSNRGEAPLETAFRRWDWSRGHLPSGDSVVLYDVEPLRGPPLHLALRFRVDGSVETLASPPAAALPRTRWGVGRGTHSDAGTPAHVRRTLTDAPFYARSLVEARWHGEPVCAVHESLSLTRFCQPVVQAMLPFRMPRRTG